MEKLTKLNELKQNLINLKLVIDNEYLDKYCYLILNNENTKHIKFTTHKHHIIPRYYYKKHHLEIDNSSKNLVILYIKDHLLAHYYLFKCSYDNNIENINLHCLRHLLITHRDIANISDDNILKIIEENKNYKYNFSEEHRRKISIAIKGKIISEETRRKISLSNKGRHHRKDVKEKISKKMKGIKKSKETRKNMSKAQKGLKHKHLSEETRRKMSLSRKGKKRKPCSEETKRKISIANKGRISPTKGIHHTDETKEKIKLALKNMKDPEGRKQKIHLALYGKKLTEEHKKNIGLGELGFKWINNGIINKKVKPEICEKLLLEGWQFGRILHKKNI